MKGRAKVFGILVMVVMLLVLGACQLLATEPAPTTGEGQPSTPPAPVPSPSDLTGTKVSSEPKHGLELEVSVDKVEYEVGEPIKVNLSIVNTTAGKVSFSTRTAQLFDLIIKGGDLERELRWSHDLVFAQVITPRTIGANGALSATLFWKVNIGPGEVSLVGITSLLSLDGEEMIMLEAPPIEIRVR